jgi:hypothetical protein
MEISQMLGEEERFRLSGKPRIQNDCIIIIPDTSTTEFAKYMGTFHSYGKAVNMDCEHVCIFPYPIMGHARVSFHPMNEFYSGDNFYFMLMTVKNEDSIKDAIKRGLLDSVSFEIQPIGKESEFGDI